jgi:hypothetical protein
MLQAPATKLHRASFVGPDLHLSREITAAKHEPASFLSWQVFLFGRWDAGWLAIWRRTGEL